MKLKISILGVVITILTGCGAAPKTAIEFRDAVDKGSMGHEKETYVVDRPFKVVADTLKERANACLNVGVKSTRTYKISGAQTEASHTVIYNPTFKISSNLAQLQVQLKVTGEKVVKLQEEPEGGYFVLVAEVTALNKSSSKVNVYYATYKAGSLVKAVKNWATGKNLDCPDVVNDKA